MPDAPHRDFTGQVAFVTGGSRGIGLAVAKVLIQRGASVFLTARSADGLADAASELDAPTRTDWLAGKADDPEHREAAVAQAMKRFGRIDMLVNNTGVNPAYGRVLEADLAASRKVWEVNVLSAMAWSTLVHAAWMGENGGSIVNVASFAGIRPAQGIGVYGASKAALSLLTQQLAWELAPAIRVNAVAPAVIQTRFSEALYSDRDAEVAAAYPLKRLGDPDDVAFAVAFLLSREASWITGQTMVIDGGLGLTGGIE